MRSFCYSHQVRGSQVMAPHCRLHTENKIKNYFCLVHEILFSKWATKQRRGKIGGRFFMTSISGCITWMREGWQEYFRLENFYLFSLLGNEEKKKNRIYNKINLSALARGENKCQYLPSLPFVEGRVGEEARQSTAAEAATSPEVGSASQVERRSVNTTTHKGKIYRKTHGTRTV